MLPLLVVMVEMAVVPTNEHPVMTRHGNLFWHNINPVHTFCHTQFTSTTGSRSCCTGIRQLIGEVLDVHVDVDTQRPKQALIYPDPQPTSKDCNTLSDGDNEKEEEEDTSEFSFSHDASVVEVLLVLIVVPRVLDVVVLPFRVIHECCNCKCDAISSDA